jgi:hypothetical protein
MYLISAELKKKYIHLVGATVADITIICIFLATFRTTWHISLLATAYTFEINSLKQMIFASRSARSSLEDNTSTRLFLEIYCLFVFSEFII